MNKKFKPLGSRKPHLTLQVCLSYKVDKLEKLCKVKYGYGKWLILVNPIWNILQTVRHEQEI